MLRPLMSGLDLYAHPFSSYSQKAFMAFYEKGVPFELKLLSPENPDIVAERHALWPLDRFPVLRADGKTIVESTIIVEWLDQRHPGAQPLIPKDPDAALEVRTLDRVFDNYVMTPMMTMVFDRLRPEDKRDPYGVAIARENLNKAYGWLNERMVSCTWAAADQFSLADCAGAPALFYADWVHPLGEYKSLDAYLKRLCDRPSFARCVEDARPSRALFPGGVPAHVT
ncbi:MAG TPA: glutathione S-transferase family protein [Rhodopila sp.]|nr:glutathione S-transferase family protein [Rhodopila sp.]